MSQMNDVSSQPIETTQYIERKPNSDKYRVIGKGVTVELLSTLIGYDMDYVQANYNLTKAEIHAAWSFYYDHKEEIDARIAAENAESEEGERRTEALRQQWTQRKQEKEAADLSNEGWSNPK